MPRLMPSCRHAIKSWPIRCLESWQLSCGSSAGETRGMRAWHRVPMAFAACRQLECALVVVDSRLTSTPGALLSCAETVALNACAE